ncbi:TetR/AcrR family transcriptional regulator [Actinosynnema pretiosum subsp. pretiosum]|uniref:Transcriptional regulator, TetR family n=2 Tax=Actinosynnema TaxID=40566 RepID=C6W944_ACTMD|nr:TetR/AcrR family transcriptional regulator [Actinosynnema mirum]ACU39116.1 transcriptional regulator, TetR family [Actinosynnema mirum DSM 43827]QUF03406.1 TetR/AcrR family transcriptional regulator [Actinosynnema pretiosum subsp. pretiosum]
MPTGVAIQDARNQLFDAAERVLLRDGPSGLTSRAVTTEASFAKGVLHRHFADFDAFLAEFVLDRAARPTPEVESLPDQVGRAEVVDNLTSALTALYASAAVAVVPLLTFRTALRDRLRDAWPAGVPVLTDAAVRITAYLDAERAAGRLPDTLPADALGPALVGSTHLLHTGPGATEDAVRRVVATVLRV